MQVTDKDQLKEFISQRIDHRDNPESFRYYLDLEINNHLKKEQQSLKDMKMRIRHEQLERDGEQRRKRLEGKIEQKKQKGSENRQKSIEERVKNMAELRRRKEEFTAEKLKQMRREDLKKSLDKIKTIEKEKEDYLERKLTKTVEDSRLSRSMNISRIEKKMMTNQAEYDTLVQKLKQKGIFALPNKPNHKQLSDLYAQRAKYAKSQILKQEEEVNAMLASKLEKIQEVRMRKERLLQQKAGKLKQQDDYHQSLKKSKRRELELKQRSNMKELLKKQANKMQHLLSLKDGVPASSSTAKMQRSALSEDKTSLKLNPQANYKKEIRRMIQNYTKGNN